MSLRLILIVVAAVAGATLTIVLVSRGNGGKAAATPTPVASIQGPQARLGDLIYNVSDIRILKVNRPADAPYLVNLQAPPKGIAYLGVFLKIYNTNKDKAQPVADGYLLEPTQNASLTAFQQSSESPYVLKDTVVPAGSEVPIPGSASAAGPIPGALVLYMITRTMTLGQPFRLVIHTGAENAFIFLPKVPLVGGGGGH